MEALLVKYGYILLFGGVIVEGEVFLLTAAFLAHRGTFDLPTVVAVAVAATMLGDQVYYQAARARGRAWLERRKGARAKYARIIELTARRGPWLLLVSRYTYGFRIVIPAACGAVGMPAGLFTFMDFIAVAVWAGLMAALGYYGGAAIAGYLHDFQRIVVWIVVAGILCVAAVFSVRRMNREARLRELGMADVHAVMPFVMSCLTTGRPSRGDGCGGRFCCCAATGTATVTAARRHHNRPMKKTSGVGRRGNIPPRSAGARAQR